MNKSQKIIVVCALVVALVIGGTAFALHNKRSNEPKTTSKSETAQSDYSNGEPRDSNQGNSQGGAVDTGGNDANGSGGVSSESGLITLESPAKDATISSCSIIAGSANNLDKVQYRLIDDNVGVLAQGELQVSAGKFSGKLVFSPNAPTGRLDVYSFDSSGREVNVIEQPVHLEN